MNGLVYICEICQTVLEEYQCRAMCPNCGRVFDCTDLPALPANARLDAQAGWVMRPGAEHDALPGLLPAEEEESAPPSPPGDAQQGAGAGI